MKVRLMSIGLVAGVLALISPHDAWGADGAALYKSKCASCHGASGEGKPAMKAPSLATTTKSTDGIVAMLTKGDSQMKAPHSKGISGIDQKQAGSIAEYLKTLK